jgi:site-specific DNA-methyltransferase (adenine-specific)
MERPLLEKGADTFIRINEAVPILRKVQAFNEESFSTIVSARKPFGLASDFFADPKKYKLPAISEKAIPGGISIVGTYKYKTVNRYVPKDYPFPQGQHYLGKYKVFVSQVLDNGFDWTKERLRPFLGMPNDACTETFLCVGEYNTKEEAENVISYMNTNLFHLLMHLKKVSHHVVSKVYGFCPLQDFSRPWTDHDLYEKYGLTDDEIRFIEDNIKPMDEDGGAE